MMLFKNKQSKKKNTLKTKDTIAVTKKVKKEKVKVEKPKKLKSFAPIASSNFTLDMLYAYTVPLN